jgi:hypothetical protein
MHSLQRLRSLLFAIALATFAAGALGCTPRKAPVEAPRPKPRNAAELADAIVGAKLSSLVYFDRVRGHAIAGKLVALEDVRAIFEGTGVEPLRDVERAAIASTGIHEDDQVVVIAQHKLAEEQVRASLQVMVDRTEPKGAWLELGVPAARVTMRGHERVVAMVEPGFVAVLPPHLASQALRFAGTGGFPDPTGPEAAITHVKEPSVTLRAARGPEIPPTLSSARIGVVLQADGSADIAVQARSTDAAQAAQDAATMTEEVERATSIKISILRVRLFKPVPFRANAELVESDVHLTPGELELLFRLIPRR